MTEPIFWLMCSLLLVAVCLTAVLMAAIPALQELARASRSAEKLFDTLHRELPPTLKAIRLTGSEINSLTDEISDGIESAGNVVKQVDQNLRVAQRQVKEVGITAQSFWVGAQAAWKSLAKPSPRQSMGSRRPGSSAQSLDSRRLSKGDRPIHDIQPTAGASGTPLAQTHPLRRTKKGTPPPLDHPTEPLSERSPTAEPE